jgi:predicted MFS family arabinose efflux permease
VSGPGAGHGPEVRRLVVFFATVYFVESFIEPRTGIAGRSIFFVLKDRLGLDAAGTAAFFAIIGIAFAAKPLYGLLSDLVPIRGSQRRTYLLLASATAGLGWLGLGRLHDLGYAGTLAPLALAALGIAFADVVCDAVMVERGQALGLTGRFQAAQWFAMYAATFVAGIAGGYLSEHATYTHTFDIAAVLSGVTLVAAMVAVREPRAEFDAASVRERLAACHLGVRSSQLWLVAAFLLLAGFTPALGIPLEYYLVNVLGMSRVELGWLATVGSAGAMAGAVTFGHTAHRWPLRRVLNVAIGLGVAAMLGYCGLAGWWSATILTFAINLVTMVAFLTTMDLAARAVPSRAEATFFAALMSVDAIAGSTSAWLGGALYDTVGLIGLVAIGAATRAGCWLLVPLLSVEQKARATPA